MTDLEKAQNIKIAKKNLEDYLNSLSGEDKVRAKAMQWRLEHKLKKHKNTIDRMNKMCEILFEEFYKLNESLSPFRTK